VARLITTLNIAKARQLEKIERVRSLPLTFFDTETSALAGDPNVRGYERRGFGRRLLQFGAVRGDDTIEMLVRPRGGMWDRERELLERIYYQVAGGAHQTHGIPLESILSRGVETGDALSRIYDFASGSILVGFNPRFDTDVLRAEGKYVGDRAPMRAFDILGVARKAYPWLADQDRFPAVEKFVDHHGEVRPKPFSLVNIAHYLGITRETGEAHTALSDAEIERGLFFRMLDEGRIGEQDLDRLLSMRVFQPPAATKGLLPDTRAGLGPPKPRPLITHVKEKVLDSTVRKSTLKSADHRMAKIAGLTALAGLSASLLYASSKNKSDQVLTPDQDFAIDAGLHGGIDTNVPVEGEERSSAAKHPYGSTNRITPRTGRRGRRTVINVDANSSAPIDYDMMGQILGKNAAEALGAGEANVNVRVYDNTTKMGDENIRRRVSRLI
jgi:DNA polymerase III epsilon subunit-like protein